MDDTGLRDRRLRVLVIEDESLLSMMLEDMLDQLGYEVAGICPDVASALAAIANESLDGALLDLNLQSERADTVAHRLREKGVPFAIATGAADGAEQLGAVVIVAKPYRFGDIEEAMNAVRRAA